MADKSKDTEKVKVKKGVPDYYETNDEWADERNEELNKKSNSERPENKNGSGEEPAGNSSVSDKEDVEDTNEVHDVTYIGGSPVVFNEDVLQNNGEKEPTDDDKSEKWDSFIKGDKEKYNKFLLDKPNLFKAIFSDSGLSFAERLAHLGEGFSTLVANATKGAYAGLNHQPLPDATVGRMAGYYNNAFNKNKEREQSFYDKLNEGRLSQAERVSILKNMSTLNGWADQDIEDLASRLPIEELSEQEFKSRYFGSDPDKQYKNILKKAGYDDSVIDNAVRIKKSEKAGQELDNVDKIAIDKIDSSANSYVQSAYKDYRSARTMYSQGSQARQNLQTEQSNAQDIEKKAIDLAYYGAQKDFETRQDCTNAKKELLYEIDKIDILMKESGKTIGEYMSVYSQFINMTGNIVTQSGSTTNNVSGGGSAGVKGLVSAQASAGTMKNINETVDKWKLLNQKTADDVAKEWTEEYKNIYLPTRIGDLEFMKKIYRERIKQIEEFEKKLPDSSVVGKNQAKTVSKKDDGNPDERLNVIRERLGYNGNGRYNRDPAYYINRLGGNA